MSTPADGPAEAPQTDPASEPVPGQRRHRTLTIVAAVVSALVVVGAAGGAWLIHSIGPAFGIWWPAPSPQSYGSAVLGLMDSGLHATGQEWETARADAAGRIKEAATHDEVDDILADAIKVAGGRHSFIMDAADLQSSIDSYTAPTSSMDGCVLTVTVPAFMGTAEQGKEYATTLADALGAEGVCGVVVDLRDNDGGDMGPMLAGLSPLLPDGVITSFVSQGRTSDVTLKDGAIKGGGSPTSVGQRDKLDVPVAVLTSQTTASSGEQALLAFRGLDNTRVFGQATAGYASVNQTFPLYTGRTMVLTIGTSQARTGEGFGEEPIAPDVETPRQGAPEAATAWIASRP
ncbi:S41 family peptidase [Actinomyces israelii]|uniref:S41 family peptidase n=1 Tax=Actinomyces israelii TaxID=1659 RepID=UPI001E4B7F6E|nr:S41 family peptidase [Actinomyces israelii]